MLCLVSSFTAAGDRRPPQSSSLGGEEEGGSRGRGRGRGASVCAGGKIRCYIIITNIHMQLYIDGLDVKSNKEIV